MSEPAPLYNGKTINLNPQILDGNSPITFKLSIKPTYLIDEKTKKSIYAVSLMGKYSMELIESGQKINFYPIKRDDRRNHMKIKTYTEIIESLPPTDDRKELALYDGSEILDDIIDFVEIQFPQWEEELGSWASEYILHHINLYIDWYKECKRGKYIECLNAIYTDLNDFYYEWVSNFKYARSLQIEDEED